MFGMEVNMIKYTQKNVYVTENCKTRVVKISKQTGHVAPLLAISTSFPVTFNVKVDF